MGKTKKQNHPVDHSEYKTEEMLKQEAKERAQKMAALQAKRKPATQQQKKAENFWYHYKWHTIAVVAGLAMAIFFLRDVVFKPQTDMTIIMVSSDYIDQETIQTLSDGLSQRIEDASGDGKVEVLVDSIQTPVIPLSEEEAAAAAETADGMQGVDPMGAQSDYASTIKLTTLVAAGSDPVYLLDESAYAYFVHMASSSDEEGDAAARMFLPDAVPLKETVLADLPGCEPLREMVFYVRNTRAQAKSEEYFDYCVEQIANLR